MKSPLPPRPDVRPFWQAAWRLASEAAQSRKPDHPRFASHGSCEARARGSLHRPMKKLAPAFLFAFLATTAGAARPAAPPPALPTRPLRAIVAEISQPALRRTIA